jgi:hypothetical protein
MITQELKKLVVEEALNIRKYATKEEMKRLNFARLCPTNQNLCVYGHLTGDCHNIRAIELLDKCTRPYTESIHHILNFKKSRQKVFNNEGGHRDFSPIEYYINQPEAKLKTLVKLIKS